MERNGAFLPTALVPPSVDLISHTEFELSAFKTQIEKDPDSPAKKALLQFLTAHHHLLEMQKEYLQGTSEASLADLSQIYCGSGSNLDKAGKHFELAITQADLAESHFDLFATNSESYAKKTGIDFDVLNREIATSKKMFTNLKAANQRICS